MSEALSKGDTLSRWIAAKDVIVAASRIKNAFHPKDSQIGDLFDVELKPEEM